MEKIINFQNVSWPITFDYPSASPGGEKTELVKKETRYGKRLHFLTPATNEIYFEIAVYPKIGVEAAIELFKKGVPTDPIEPTISPPKEDVYCGKSGQQLKATWPDRSRVVTFFELDSSTLRVIYNPKYPENRAIFESIAFLD
ncbi:MAG: hypothetical protein AAF633_25190 [Chloroflexota bacterium]